MFDRIAPRYDAAEPAPDVPHGRRLAPHRGRHAVARARRAWCSTSRAGPATSAARSPGRATRRSASTSRPACCAPRTPPRPSSAPTRCSCRSPTARSTGVTCGFALRNFAALAPVLAECGRVLRPGGRIALLDVAEPASPLARAVHGAWFRHVVPFVGGLALRPRRVPLPPRVDRVPPARAPTCSRSSTRRGHRRREPAHARVRRGPAHHGDRGRDHLRRLAAVRDALGSPWPRTARRSTARSTSSTTYIARRFRVARRRPRLRRIRSRRHGRARRRRRVPRVDRPLVRRPAPSPPCAGPRAVGALPFPGTGNLVVPALHRRARRRRPVVAHRDRRRGRAPASRPPSPRPAPIPSEFRVASLTTRAEWRAMVDHALADIVARGTLEKVVLARAGAHRRRPRLRRRRASSPTCGARSPVASSTPTAVSSARAPSCWCARRARP